MMQRIKSQSDFHLHGKNRYLVINQPLKLKPKYEVYKIINRPDSGNNSGTNGRLLNRNRANDRVQQSKQQPNVLKIYSDKGSDVHYSSHMSLKNSDTGHNYPNGNNSDYALNSNIVYHILPSLKDTGVQYPEFTRSQYDLTRIDHPQHQQLHSSPSLGDNQHMNYFNPHPNHHQSGPLSDNFHRHNTYSLVDEQKNNGNDNNIKPNGQRNVEQTSFPIIHHPVKVESNLAKKAPVQTTEPLTETEKFLNGLFDDDELYEDEPESPSRPLKYHREDKDKDKVSTTSSSLPSIDKSYNRISAKFAPADQPTSSVRKNGPKARPVHEIPNMAINFDGYESLKVCLMDKSKLNGEPRVIGINLEKKIQHHMRINDFRSLIKLIMIKNLLRLSTKLMGKYFIDMSIEEKKRLELEANRFFTIDVFLVDDDEINFVNLIGESGRVKMKINDKYEIFPNEFLKFYLNKLLSKKIDPNYKIINLYFMIPQALGSLQRKAIKEGFKDMCENILILTRPIIGSVISNTSINSSINSTKLIFDMTLDTLDATIVNISHKSASFSVYKVISNVGDISLGLEDIDERIANFVLNEKIKFDSQYDEKTIKIDILSVVCLVADIKKFIYEHGAVILNLNGLGLREYADDFDQNCELLLDKTIIRNLICRDIYEWSLIHIKRAFKESNLDIRQIDQALFLFNDLNMPGFVEYLRESFANINFKLISEEEMGLGALKTGIKLRLRKFKAHEILSRSIGVGMYNGMVNFLIPRNTQLPYTNEFTFTREISFDLYEGERPHVKYCKYIGKLKFEKEPSNQHKSSANVNTRVQISIDNEGIMKFKQLRENSGPLETMMISFDEQKPNRLMPNNLNLTNLELDPIEADRFKKDDFNLNKSLEELDSFLSSLRVKHSKNTNIMNKIADTKNWIFKNRRTLSIDQCKVIRNDLQDFITLNS